MQDRTTWPDLPAPFAAALTEAVGWIGEQFAPVGITLSGTILRGSPDPGSDLDLVVIHEQTWRQRAQRHFDDVPAEIFVNSPAWIRRAFGEDARRARPVMIHMLATGHILQDPTGIMRALGDEAREALARGPDRDAMSELVRRYGIATLYEDAVDLRHRDPERAVAMLGDAVVDAARLHFIQADRWVPREKDLFAALERFDPALGAAVRRALGTEVLDERFTAADQIVRTVTGAAGSFAWESDRQPFPTP